MGGYNGPEDPNRRSCTDNSMNSSQHNDWNTQQGDEPIGEPRRTYCCSTDALEIGEGARVNTCMQTMAIIIYIILWPHNTLALD